MVASKLTNKTSESDLRNLAALGEPLSQWNFDLVVGGEIDWEVSRVDVERGKMRIKRLLTTTSNPKNLTNKTVDLRLYQSVGDTPKWISAIYQLGDRVGVEMSVNAGGSLHDAPPIMVTEVYAVKGLLYFSQSQ
ncbi:hypothetical protein BcepSauron_301 [Burkholderia phage BcepSauron]|uniref:Uncharacterized protein n=1 Tax=Burkholderia phage BcepSauron TaxID=2530033 RepID=A0A482MKV8_9CAUD|nr:hypothetical protein H1O17_gp301 [Burkholderia phage BcepSauron]QBQ74681.1 hypothetical protein BcepSauron_301 [Burkholderia phage BcepSauron]